MQAPASASYRRRLIPLIILLLTITLVIIYSNSLQEPVVVVELGADGDSGPVKTVPDFTLQDLDGNPVTLSQLRGKVVVLNFWASWCDPCRTETFAMETFMRRYSDRALPVAVNMREPVDTVRNFVRAFGASYPVLLDQQGKVTDMYRVRGVPENFFIDADGVARFHWPGALSFEEMQAAFEATTGSPIDMDRPGPVTPGKTLSGMSLLLPGDPLVVTGGQLFARGDDDGWSPLTLPAEVLAVGFNSAATVLLTADGTLWRWEPDGEPVRWGSLPDGWLSPGGATVLAVHPVGQDIIVWHENGGLLFAHSSLEEWKEITPPPAPEIFSLALDPHTPQRILAGWSGGVMESLDGGQSWLPLTLAAESPDPENRIPWDSRFQQPVYAIAFSPEIKGRVYYGTGQGIWISNNGGRFLNYLSTSPYRRIQSVIAFSGTGEQVDRLLAGTPNGDLYISNDSGDSWSLYEY